MKSFAIIFLVIASVAFAQKVNLTEEQKTKLAEFKKECVASSGVALDAVENAKKGIIADDQKMKDFLFCVAQKIGFMDKDGHFNVDVMMAKISAQHGEQIAKDVVGVCTAKTEANGPETSFVLAKCLSEKSKQHVSLA
ncbi:PREDICTED: general odorant-binding protein 56a-like [Nicrophorus vespilloides]|uniref:General odorant-binding protein 56a-like n=1 Tax=Nicrophorus vespilloides TaxID=110193 RepID=A0ABM1N886_NICVS|nr:PREDICTED: general odorant-binding protein 56a-like [Nicrophorus vespilloides]